jgi:hypothetical protein
MSSTSFLESEAFPSASKEPGCEPSHSARLTPSAVVSSESTGPTCRPTTTLEPSPPIGCEQMELLPMSSVAASPARTSALPERAPGLKASAAVYGKTMPESLARFDRDTSSWRTSQLCLGGDFAEFSETWPRSGMTRSGTAYQLPPLAPLTDATESGSWPTPRSNGATGPGRGPNLQGGMNLQSAVFFHTPRTTPRSARELDGESPLGFGGLNPTWVEWLMGYPIGHTDLRDSATRSSRRSPKSSAKQS